MSLFRACILLSIATLAACGGSNTTAPVPPASKSGPLTGKVADIVDDTNDLGLGKNWYLYETFGGQTFRWVDNNAEIVVKNPRTNLKAVALELEAGPSLGEKKFTLQIVENGKTVASLPVNGHQWVLAQVPVHPGKPATFALHVNGSGKHTSDPRILNFRVFTMADADIVDPGSGITLGSNWDIVERYAGQTFRWVDNDAAFTVTSNGSKTQKIHVVTLPGPGMSGHQLAIAVRNASGATVATINPDKKGNATFSLPVKSGANAFTLHVSGGGHKTGSDPRILDFRVFSLTPG
jgi:hypothetical protein